MRRFLACALSCWLALSSAVNPALAALSINNLSGFNAVTAAGESGPTVSFRGCATDLSNLTAYTFSGFDVGAAEAGRIILVGAVVEDSADSLTPGAMTIGGVNAAIASSASSSWTVRQEFGIAAVPSGATTDIVVTMDEAVTSMSICVWTLYGFSTAAFADQSGVTADTGAVITTTVDVTAGDLLAAMCITGGNTETITWDSDFATASTATNATEHAYAYAYTYPVASTQVNLGLTCDWSGTTDAQMRSVVVSP